ncbi:RPC7 family DNA-directed RNA polymerase III subunit [Saliphagus infecundisoli]|uniref:RPC7 family DNA-directed RNA polymerase III subunit n=1 Tax=Saliphagus infecundisoli TaxID=1849069 RepID=A0ABD5QJ62_9EURY|nr:RPC7 family DNA-directed RNA polymerase III subunit [Saliphagus infecundisoli]
MTDDGDDGEADNDGEEGVDRILEKLEEEAENRRDEDEGKDENEDGVDLPEPLEDEGTDGGVSSQAGGGGFSLFPNQFRIADNLIDTGVMRMVELVNQQMQEVLDVIEEHREEMREVIETMIDLEEPKMYDLAESECMRRRKRWRLSSCGICSMRWSVSVIRIWRWCGLGWLWGMMRILGVFRRPMMRMRGRWTSSHGFMRRFSYLSVCRMG